MFFLEMEGWRQHMEDLGLWRVIDHLNDKGIPTEWVTRVADPKEKYVFWHPKGKPWYESSCPCYEGYYLGGNAGAVKCTDAGELLPGTVWYEMCHKEYEKCPYFRAGGKDGQKSVSPEGGVIRAMDARIGTRPALTIAKSRSSWLGGPSRRKLKKIGTIISEWRIISGKR